MRFHRSSLVWAGLLTVTVLLASRAQAIPSLPIILVSQNQGLFGMTLPATPPPPASSSKGNQTRAGKTMNQLSVQLVQGALSAGFPNQPTSKTAKLIDKLYSGLLSHLTKPTGHPRPSASNLSALGLYAVVSIPTLVANDVMSLRFTLGNDAFTTQLSQHATLDTKNGASLVVDYSALPQTGSVDGTVVAALVRGSGAPTQGVLVIALADSALSTALSDFGATNSNQSGATVTIPYGVSITGSVSGEHHTGTPDFTDLYYAKQDRFGIGVPDSLAAQAESLMTHIR